MIHGDEDQTASPEAARRFAQTFGARLIQVPGGDHSLSGPGMPQLEMCIRDSFCSDPPQERGRPNRMAPLYIN